MTQDTEHICYFINQLKLSEENNKTIFEIFNKINDNEIISCDFYNSVYAYSVAETMTIKEAKQKLYSIAEDMAVSAYSIYLAFLIQCSENLLKKYISNHLSEELYWNAMDDIRCKTEECLDRYHVVGISPFEWYDGFFKLDRFALGRFQYEPLPFPVDFTTKNGIHIKKGTKSFNFHIPSSGISLTDAVRLDSYRQAYEFYQQRGETEGEYIVFKCSSWLLYPKHAMFLPPESNMIKFLNDFDIFESAEQDVFNYGFHIFGDMSGKAIDELDEKTALQRSYKSWLLNGNKPGYGRGVIVFDGQKIIS